MSSAAVPTRILMREPSVSLMRTSPPFLTASSSPVSVPLSANPTARRLTNALSRSSTFSGSKVGQAGSAVQVLWVDHWAVKGTPSTITVRIE